MQEENKSKQEPKRSLSFVNTAAHTFALDPNPTNNKSREVRGFAYSKVMPTPLKNPEIACLSQPCLRMIGLDKDEILASNESREEYAQLLCGNKLFEGSIPISHNYCGHQFGVFAGQLGDGRAITIGDVNNEKNEIWELQLKGAGKTPYSRFADGRAVLRSSIREFLCSEAMHYLGIPTSRAASLVVSDTLVERDPLYSGKVIKEKCAVVMRVAPSFFRFGSFETFKETDKYSGMIGPSHGLKEEMMPQMLEYVIKNFYPHIYNLVQDNQHRYQLFFEDVVLRTANMVALWQCHGYVHGVMNTDNMSILGLTIDYGPYGFMEHFNPKMISNYSDKEGRYCYENQPSVCKWNLIKLAEALHPLLDLKWSSSYVNSKFDELFTSAYLGKMGRKLGYITDANLSKDHLEDNEFECIRTLFEVMAKSSSDFTNTFRTLAMVSRSKDLTEADQKVIEILVKLSAPVEHLISQKKSKYSFASLEKIRQILEKDPNVLAMFGLDPDEARKELQAMEDAKKLESVSNEEQKAKDRKLWQQWILQYKQTLAEMDPSVDDEKRRDSMNKANPKFILRNYLMEEAIRQAEQKEDFSRVEELLQMSFDPFNEENISEVSTQPPPKWAYELCVSCSS